LNKLILLIHFATWFSVVRLILWYRKRAIIVFNGWRENGTNEIPRLTDAKIALTNVEAFKMPLKNHKKHIK